MEDEDGDGAVIARGVDGLERVFIDCLDFRCGMAVK
jgi:hypothetical protein